jgi:hypothetical protein
MVVTSLTAIPSALCQEAQGTVQNKLVDDSGSSVEAARGVVRSAAEWLASGVDGWFGNKPFSEGGKVSDGQVGLNIYGRQDQGADASVRFNARFKLPNLEAKTYLFTGRDNWKELITDKPAAFAIKQQLLHPDTPAEQAFFAGIGHSSGESTDARIGFRGGLKPFAQVRYRRKWLPTADDQLELNETLFLTTADRLGSSTTLTYQHQLSPTLVSRWLNAVTVTQTDPNAEWHGSLGAYRSMGLQRLLSLEILASSKQNTGVALTDYGVQVRWEQPVDHDRLIGEIIVGHFWPQSVDGNTRSTAWALGAGLKMSF